MLLSLPPEAPVKAKPFVDTETLFATRPDLLDDSYVYVHGHLRHSSEDVMIRIWKTTFLIAKEGDNRSQLLHAENISFAPLWTLVPRHFNYHFLLIFSGLPRSCRVFDLVEEIAQPHGFFVADIPRNDSDVYHVHFDF